MAIRGLEGNQNAQPRVFAHDALDLQNLVGAAQLPNTENIGVCLYVGVANDITVKMEGSSTEVLFKGVTAGAICSQFILFVSCKTTSPVCVAAAQVHPQAKWRLR